MSGYYIFLVCVSIAAVTVIAIAFASRKQHTLRELELENERKLLEAGYRQVRISYFFEGETFHKLVWRHKDDPYYTVKEAS